MTVGKQSEALIAAFTAAIDEDRKIERLKEVRYDIRQVAKVIDVLTNWRDASEDTLDTEESRDYPNDERVDALNERIDALTEAIDALEGIE